jgi:hypothetical protein
MNLLKMKYLLRRLHGYATKCPLLQAYLAWEVTFFKKKKKCRAPVAHTCNPIATQEAEIRRIVVQSQPQQIVCKTLSQKTLHKKRAGGVTQGEGPEFKPQYHKEKKIHRPGVVVRVYNPSYLGEGDRKIEV